MSSRGSQPYGDLVLSFPLASCVGLSLMAFRVSVESGHPFVSFARLYAQSGKTREAREVLENYYRNWRPRTQAEVYGLVRCRPPQWATETVTQRRWPLPLPWIAATATQPRRRPRQAIGPATRWRIAKKARQLAVLTASIKAEGVRCDHANLRDHIRGHLLSHGTRSALLLTGGNNRAAAAAALDFQNVPVLITSVVRREDAGGWPNVMTGQFSEEQALEVFDRVSSATQPAEYGVNRSSTGRIP